MFFKGSRYKDISETSTIHAPGQKHRSKALRWIPDRLGTFLHTVNQSDRLDLLAYKYYGNPQKWWLICDANPDFPYPSDLLDQGPIIHEVFTLEASSDENRWSLLNRALRELIGIRQVQTDTIQSTLNVTYNRKEIDQAGIINAIGSEGFIIKDKLTAQRFGKKIIIPPNQIV